MILALLGPHGAGKTTLGQALARRMAVPFDDELGRRLATVQRPATISATAAQPSFDDAVLEAELARDVACPDGALRVVETWHPGNLGFTSLRSPERLPDHAARVRRHLHGREALVVVLWAPRPVLRARQSEAAPLSFFLDVSRRAERFARHLGLPLLARLRTDVESAEALADRLIALLPLGQANRAAPRGCPVVAREGLAIESSLHQGRNRWIFPGRGGGLYISALCDASPSNHSAHPRDIVCPITPGGCVLEAGRNTNHGPEQAHLPRKRVKRR